jgi:ATP-dependent Clp protease ATP-binding subunit ClpB
VDEVILFHRLRRKDMDKIVEIQLKRLEKLLADRKITLDLDETAINWLADKGYDPAYGARPLKRVMQKELQDPLAEKILGVEIKDGSTVVVTSGSDRLIFRAKAGAAKAEEAETEAAA